MATKKKSTRQRTSKNERMKQMEREDTFVREITLWVIVAVSALLFISNFGIGGKVGGAVSGFLFGLFGMLQYIMPLALLAGSFFLVSNRGNKAATFRVVVIGTFLLFLMMFVSLVTKHAVDLKDFTPNLGFVESRGDAATKVHIGGGFFGSTLSYLLVMAFGKIGAYIVDFVVMIICVVLITGRSIMKDMKHGGKKVVETAKEKNEQRKEYIEYRQEERKKRSEQKVSGVTVDTKIDAKDAKASQDMNELKAPKEEIINKVPEVAVESKKVTSVAPMITGNFSKDITKEPVKEAAKEMPLPKVTDPELLFANTKLTPEMAQPVPQAAEPVMEPAKRQAKMSEEEKNAGIEGISQNIAAEEPVKNYVFPPVTLLKKGSGKKTGNSESQIMETAQKLQATLATFGVNVTVTDVSCGPAVTRYEIQPEMGVKVSKIVGLADDIKLNLAAEDIRIEAPIPGKSAVGIEVPNKENVMVSFRDLIESPDFTKSTSNITFAVGMDIAGQTKVTDIAKMPHLLIAGATGSGKSVCINTIVMSILYKAKPEDVRMIMIDPKVVELSVYNGIPHLLMPVVTDPKKAANALNWAVAEMTERYEKFAEVGVRDMKGYNEKLASIQVPEGQERPKKMYQIVIIVDELADLMMVASKDVEESICRLAQLARACGIHLIIATQRPSVNVITGLIKANMPSRIAFAVSSGVDSRTILDMIGAEKLLGKGDMLFYPQGIPKPLRIQGAFVSDEEVSSVVAFLTEQNGSMIVDEKIKQKMDTMEASKNQTVSISDADEETDGRDAYFYEAAKIIVDKEKASIGMLQRYLKVGFNRAARIMDQLEEAQIVGPELGTKPRSVLMSPEQLQQFIDEN